MALVPVVFVFSMRMPVPVPCPPLEALTWMTLLPNGGPPAPIRHVLLLLMRIAADVAFGGFTTYMPAGTNTVLPVELFPMGAALSMKRIAALIAAVSSLTPSPLAPNQRTLISFE